MAKEKLPAFLYCINEQSKEPDRKFILHTQEPSILVEVRSFKDIKELDFYLDSIPSLTKQIIIKNHYFALRVIRSGESEASDTIKLEKTLNRMSKWWHSYFTSQILDN